MASIDLSRQFILQEQGGFALPIGTDSKSGQICAAGYMSG
jgi:hypothetical protein